MSSRTEGDARIRFGRFALDTANARLYRGDQVVAVRGKTLAVLAYLASRPGRLVTKDELLAELWPDVYVSEDVLVGCVRELRLIFGDTRGAPRFIETVYRRGYRWVAENAAATHDGDAVGTRAMAERVDATGTGAATPSRRPIVGRDDELARLRGWLDDATSGTRQMVFVSGEAGIGKTALVDAFLQALPPTTAIARGQCVEQYGPAEPFLPLVDALERLSRPRSNAWASAILARCLPEAFFAPAASQPAGAATGIMPDRAVRLLGGAVEALAAERTLVVVLEDLQWSDPSTLDVLSYVARRPEASRLLLVATYRPTELILRRHPLRGLEQELRAHGQSAVLPLGRLASSAVARWLAARGPAPPRELVTWLHRRTDGHPLFLITLFESLVAEGLVACADGAWKLDPRYAEFGVPESLRLMIDRQVEALDDADRQLLECASVAGAEFSAASVAAASERDVVAVEARCDALARDGHFIRVAGAADWPDGTVAGAYAFLHELHRSTLYARLSPAHARALHERVGRRLEEGYGTHADVVAAELATHFEHARDPVRAAVHLEKAATQCTLRGAHREAVAILRRASAMVALQPDTPERTDRLLFLNLRLGVSLLVAEDYADPDVGATFQTCRELAERAAAFPPLLAALAGLHAYHAARAELADAARLLPRVLELAEQLPFPETTLVAHTCAAWNNWSRGELAAARAHAARAIAAKPTQPMAFPTAFDLVGYAFGTGAFAAMALGEVADARALSEEGLAWSRATARPVDRATAVTLAALLHAFLDEPAMAAERAAEALAVAEEHGYRQWRAMAGIVAAWAAAVTDRSAASVDQLTARIDGYTRMGLRAQLSALLCLAAAAAIGAGETKDRARALLDRADAHARDTGEEWYVPELYRVRGELVAEHDRRAAEDSLRHAGDVARSRGMHLWERRASDGLARLARKR